MKHIAHAVVAGLLALGCEVADATSYQFSYTFADGDAVTGSFDGIANGNLIDSLTGISMAVNGTAVGGPIFGQAGGFDPAPATASFDGTQNNLFFRNAAGSYFSAIDGGSDYGPAGTNLFFLFVAGSANSCDSASGGAAPGFTCPGLIGPAPRWSVSAIPEPGVATLLVLGLGMVGWIAATRRQARRASGTLMTG